MQRNNRSRCNSHTCKPPDPPSGAVTAWAMEVDEHDGRTRSVSPFIPRGPRSFHRRGQLARHLNKKCKLKVNVAIRRFQLRSECNAAPVRSPRPGHPGGGAESLHRIEGFEDCVHSVKISPVNLPLPPAAFTAETRSLPAAVPCNNIKEE